MVFNEFIQMLLDNAPETSYESNSFLNTVYYLKDMKMLKHYVTNVVLKGCVLYVFKLENIETGITCSLYYHFVPPTSTVKPVEMIQGNNHIYFEKWE